MTDKLVDVRFLEHYKTCDWLARLCYPIALSIEVSQPITAGKLLDSVYCARAMMQELVMPLGLKFPELRIKRATKAIRCTRAVLRRLSKEEPKEAARIAAAIEVSERILTLLTESGTAGV
jgi:hypothetical protein